MITDLAYVTALHRRFNENHDEHGRFASSDSSGGGSALLDDEFKGSGSIDDPANINKVVGGKIKMTYVKVKGQNTQNYGSLYGQDIEPAGEYMSMDTLKGANKIQGFEYGTITFNKPLIVDWKSTGANGWKKDLSEKYGGKTGKKLSNALKKDGYDAIITVDGGYPSEIVNLNGQKARGKDIMDGKLERRSYDFAVKAEDTEKGAVITGRPIVYNSRANIGLFDEIIENGALSRTDLTDVRFLVNHDTNRIPLARSRRNNGNSTMKLIPDDKGLSVEVKLDIENNSEARALYSAVKRGDVSGMSFLFGVGKGGDTWEDLNTEHPTRHIRSIQSVVEVSAVTFPAYESTEIYARSKEALDSAKLALDSAKRSQEQTLDKERSCELELAKAKYYAKMKAGI